MAKNIAVYGLITSVGAGLVSLQGFLAAFVGEVFRFCGTRGLGLVVNLCRNRSMSLLLAALLLNPEALAVEGGLCLGLSRVACILAGDFSLGAVLDPLANLMLISAARIDVSSAWVLEAPAPPIIDRQSVSEALQTGILAVDSMIPVGRGQRELILGDRQTGKTCLGLDAMLNQKSEKLFSVYAAIGQKSSSILEVFLALLRQDATDYVSFLAASASSSAVHQFLAASTASALSEFFMITASLASFLVFDDLSRHAYAYREISLLLRRPPGREAYPGEIFFVHSRLLERSAKLSYARGGGSLTSFPVIESLAGDVSAYISTNVISITDGQIFLCYDFFLAGVKPAIDVGLSVTRVGSAAQWSGMKGVGAFYKLELAQAMELLAFSQFAADLGEETKARLTRGRRLVELLKQVAGSPMGLVAEVGLLAVANQNLVPKGLAKEDIGDLLALSRSVPGWLFFFLPVRFIAKSLVSL
jgi:F-type H+-transporting ATPase subunit alpha